MWSDNETVDDLIGFRVHADLIRSVVTDPRLLPVTVGVFGDWGNGKTSIMHMLRHALDPETTTDPKEKSKREKIVVLYFNGWLFEGYDDAKAALLSSILRELRDHKRFGPKVKDAAISLLKRVDIMRCLKIGWRNIGAPIMSAYVAANVGAMSPPMGAMMAVATESPVAGDDDKGGILKPAKPDNAEIDLRAFRDEFARMIRDSGMSSLVILIDDLDRCSPETIIDNLEAIKLFLNVENTAFVIGADRRIVRHAIAVRYSKTIPDDEENSEGDLRIADDYLEKLIHIPYSLPRLSPVEIETYMTLLFCQRDLAEKQFSVCVKKCDEHRERNRFRAFGMSDVREALGQDVVPAKLHDALAIVGVAANMITECLNGNPRQVKRFLNAYTLRRKLAEVARMESLRDDVLIKLMLLEYSEFQRFKELSRWQEEDRGFPRQLKAAEDAARKEGADEKATTNPLGWEKERIHRWLALTPRLAETDLSDYFWLARDKLASSMSGLTMVSPLARRVVEGLLTRTLRRATLETIGNLTGEDFQHVHGLLSRNLQRQPENREAFEAFRELVVAHLDSAQAFSETLMGIPVDRMDASLPGQLELLVRSYPALSGVFAKVYDQISKHPETKAGKALAQKRKTR